MVFLGGLDAGDGDGQFAYVWQDDLMQVVFHAATLMPNLETDPQFNKKKRHIGNDDVAIVYNESGVPYTMGTVKGQFIYATIVVEPLDFESNKISVSFKPELADHLTHLATCKIVSDQNVAMIVRQVALHCNLAANIFRAQKKEPYSSNWLERLRHIKRLKTKVLNELGENNTSCDQLHDFTGYV
jgi:tuberous sclerosis protein 2